MSLSNKVILVGMPGSGKSTLGQELSRRLELPFVDLDSRIEEVAGKQIKEIFSQHGEEYFRRIEANTLKELLLQPKSMVLSTGGGAPCFYDNMTLIKTGGVSIFLDPPIEMLAERLLRSDLSERPKLSGAEELLSNLKETYAQRVGTYLRANYQLSGKSISINEVFDTLPDDFKK